jgi:hypothetical protein
VLTASIIRAIALMVEAEGCHLRPPSVQQYLCCNRISKSFLRQAEGLLGWRIRLSVTCWKICTQSGIRTGSPCVRTAEGCEGLRPTVRWYGIVIINLITFLSYPTSMKKMLRRQNSAAISHPCFPASPLESLVVTTRCLWWLNQGA